MGSKVIVNENEAKKEALLLKWEQQQQQGSSSDLIGMRTYCTVPSKSIDINDNHSLLL